MHKINSHAIHCHKIPNPKCHYLHPCHLSKIHRLEGFHNNALAKKLKEVRRSKRISYPLPPPPTQNPFIWPKTRSTLHTYLIRGNQNIIFFKLIKWWKFRQIYYRMVEVHLLDVGQDVRHVYRVWKCLKQKRKEKKKKEYGSIMT